MYDLVGQRFGKLTVIEKIKDPKDNPTKKRIYWRCVCDCGNEYIASTTDLRSGKSHQCMDCAIKESGLKRRKNIIGNKYGMLTVLDMEYTHYENGKHRVICICKCDCGNITKTNYDVLRKPGLHSCGCARREIADKTFAKDIIGKTFGRLTVIEEYKDQPPRKVKCVCSCGNETIVAKIDVMCGHTKSCGCLQKENASKANEKDWTGYIFPNNIKTIGRDCQNAHGAWLWKFICPICGNIFSSLPANILELKRVSCGCSSKSYGEQIIERFLSDKSIPYFPQYSFDDCVNINKLKFDFGVLDNEGNLKCLIEYNGKQHYEPIEYFGGDAVFESQQKRDKIKADYCKVHNIPLYILDYTLTNDEIYNQLTNIINA